MARETDKRWKGLLIDWTEIADMDSVDYELKPLNQQQTAILLALLTYQKWPTRWINLALTKSELETYIADIEQRLMRNESSSMSCEDIEDCLEESPIIGDITSDIDDLEEDTGYTGGGTGFKPSSPTKTLSQSAIYPQLSGDIIEPENGCDDSDKDRLWAAIKALVYKVNGYNQSLLNTFTNYATESEAYDMLAAFLPIIGGVSANTASSLAIALSSNLKTSYNAAVTDAFLMNIVTELFCDAYGDCSFKLEDFISYVSNMAGGSYDAAVTTFLDVTSALAGQTTGSGIFGALSWWQFAVLGLGEKFGVSQSIPNIINSISGAAGDSSWKAYATDCYTHTGGWTVWLIFKGDENPSGGEIAYRNVAGLINPSTVNSQGVASLEVQYGNGLHYVAASNQFANRELTILNNTALFQSCRLYARKTGGTSTNMLVDCDSNTQNNTVRQITGSSFSWTSGFPVANAAGTPAPITRWSLNFSQTLASNSCIGDIAIIEFTGTGDLPIFG